MEEIFCKNMKKYEDKRNVIGNLVSEYRIKKDLTKVQLSKLLQLHAVNLDHTEIQRIETGRMIVKDFELIALCIVLDINYEDLKNCESFMKIDIALHESESEIVALSMDFYPKH